MDYAKLRVVDLKAELKKRGLPQSGLKPALIERLRTADARSNATPPDKPSLASPVVASSPQAKKTTKAPGIVNTRGLQVAALISHDDAEAPTAGDHPAPSDPTPQTISTTAASVAEPDKLPPTPAEVVFRDGSASRAGKTMPPAEDKVLAPVDQQPPEEKDSVQERGFPTIWAVLQLPQTKSTHEADGSQDLPQPEEKDSVREPGFPTVSVVPQLPQTTLTQEADGSQDLPQPEEKDSMHERVSPTISAVPQLPQTKTTHEADGSQDLPQPEEKDSVQEPGFPTVSAVPQLPQTTLTQEADGSQDLPQPEEKDSAQEAVSPAISVVPQYPDTQPANETDESRDPTQPALPSTEQAGPPSQAAVEAAVEAEVDETLARELSSTPLDAAEMSADARKRKRRSRSPVPSAEVITQKRARFGEDKAHVHLEADDLSRREDEPMQDAAVDQEAPKESSEAMLQDQENEAMDTTRHAPAGEPPQTLASLRSPPPSSEGPPRPSTETAVETSQVSVEEGGTVESVAVEELDPASSNAPRSPSPSRKPGPSPKASRFRDVFAEYGAGESQPRVSPSPPRPNEERDVTPALHPATPALYIRELMRPLHPPVLKEYLIKLATPHKAEPDPSIVQEFFLDQIRTHCLVLFTSVSAAARVRSALHGAVWPDERSRKALWVDFVPEEKVSAWIHEEQGAPHGPAARAARTKRWEVAYEESDANANEHEHEHGHDGRSTIRAVLREVGSQAPAAPREMHGAPLGPRRRDSSSSGARLPRSQPTPTATGGTAATAASSRPANAASGFVALDSLFRSTAAKPKLYYQPVSRAVSSRRLDKLADTSASTAARRGGNHNNHGRAEHEMRRYTFEDGDRWVDAGPEQHDGARGPRLDPRLPPPPPARFAPGPGYYYPGRAGPRSGGWRERDGGRRW
ncbi:MAG: hypothetical protein M1826_001643 [Phylliscum demangeonii]|nr:MAG: hypothetical protein M1826_001643 [Phylliscum demangeonii]